MAATASRVVYVETYPRHESSSHTPPRSCERAYLSDDLERPSETVHVPGEWIERFHPQWRNDVGVRQRNGSLNTGAVLKLPAALEIYEVHSSRGKAGIACSVLCSRSDDVIREDVLRRHDMRQNDASADGEDEPTPCAMRRRCMCSMPYRVWRQRRGMQESSPRTSRI